MDRIELERESGIPVNASVDGDVRDGVVLDLRDGAVLDLRGLDAPTAPTTPQALPPVDPNRVPLIGSRWVLLVALALLNALDLLTTRAVLDAGGREGNPFMAGVIDDPLAPLLVKVAGVLVVVVVVNSCPPDSRIVNRALSMAVLAYVVVVSWNLVNLLLG